MFLHTSAHARMACPLAPPHIAPDPTTIITIITQELRQKLWHEAEATAAKLESLSAAHAHAMDDAVADAMADSAALVAYEEAEQRCVELEGRMDGLMQEREALQEQVSKSAEGIVAVFRSPLGHLFSLYIVEKRASLLVCCGVTYHVLPQHLVSAVSW